MTSQAQAIEIKETVAPITNDLDELNRRARIVSNLMARRLWEVGLLNNDPYLLAMRQRMIDQDLWARVRLCLRIWHGIAVRK